MANQANIFMNISSIPGESTAKGFSNQIAIQSCSWSAHNPIQISSGTGGLSAGVPTLGSINVTAETSKASPLVLQSLVQGTAIPTITISFLKTGGSPSPYLVVVLTNCFIESASLGASGNDVATESWSIAYGAIQKTYYTQDDKGNLSKGSEMTYSIQTQS
jgi:type VI secretion system secreted protein Hcp